MNRSELYKILKDLASSNQILDSGNPAYKFCRDLFESLGIIKYFDPTDVNKIVEVLNNFEKNVDKKGQIEKEIVELNKKNEIEEKKDLGSEQLSKYQLDNLVEDYETYLEKHKNNLDKKDTIEKYIQGLRGNYSKNQVRELIDILKKASELADEKKISISKAEKILEISEELEVISEKISEQQAKELAEKIVENTVEENKKEINKLPLSKEEKDFILDIDKDTDSIERFDKKIDEATDKILNNHKDSNETLNEDEYKNTKKLLEREIKKEIYDPLEAEKRSPIKFELDDKGKLKIVEIDKNIEDTSNYVYKGTSETRLSRSITETKADEQKNVLKREVEETVKKLRKDADSSGKALDEIRSKLLRKSNSLAPVIQQMRIIQEAVMKPEEYETVRQGMEERGYTKDQIDRSINEAISTSKLISGKLGNITNAPAQLQQLTDKYGKYVPGLNKANSAVQKVVKELGGTKSLKFINEVAGYQKVLNPLTLISKIPGLQGLGMLGSQTGIEMSIALGTQIANKGLKEGVLFSLKQLLAKGAVPLATAGAEAAAGATAGGTAAVALGADVAAASVPVIGWIVAIILLAVEAIIWVTVKVFKFVSSKIENFLRSINLDDDKQKAWLKENFGGFVGGTINWGVRFIEAIFAFFALTTLSSVIIGLFAGVITFPFWGTMDLDEILIGITPNRNPMQEVKYCVTKGVGNTGPVAGNINCNESAPEPKGISVDKENFIRVAEQWRAGGGENARRCFNDVVAQAIAAGKNPDYVLWAWLHESGASNYAGIGQAYDFGVVAAGQNNFSNQLSSFLKLDPASKCLGQGSIGNDYWLAFSTNYLTGGCDPSVDVQGWNGYSYKAELESTWGWISSSPLPSSIYASSGGGGSLTPSLTNFTDENGKNFLCELKPEQRGTSTGTGGGGYLPPTSPAPTRDPNIPIPPGCPATWPVAGNYPVTQSSGGPSHTIIEAIDIMQPGGLRGVGVLATHPGVVIYSGYKGSVYGNTVIIQGSCKGQTFVTYYAHLMDSQLIPVNTTVNPGQQIGMSDNTGDYPAGNDHIHYEIRGCGAGDSLFGCQGFHTFPINDYLPVPLPNACFWNCGVTTGQ